MRVNAATVKAVAACASSDQTREVLTTVCIAPRTCTATATDSYKVVAVSGAVHADDTADAPPILLAAKIAKAMKPVKIDPYRYTLSADETAVTVSNGETASTTHAVNREFPNIAQLVGQYDETSPLLASVTVTADLLIDILKAVTATGNKLVTIGVQADPRRPIIIGADDPGASNVGALLMPAKRSNDEQRELLGAAVGLLGGNSRTFTKAGE